MITQSGAQTERLPLPVCVGSGGAQELGTWIQPAAGDVVLIAKRYRVIDNTYMTPATEQGDFPTAVESQEWLSLAESSFTFWDNDADAAYDRL